MKKLLACLTVLVLCLLLSPLRAQYAEAADGDVEITADSFPDAAFREYICDNVDKNKDGILSSAELEDVTMIFVEEMGICSLKGIEYFTSLKELFCNKNELSELDVSQNTELEVIWCQDNWLSELNLENNQKLEAINCAGNLFTSLYFYELTSLSTMKVSNNLFLKDLNCSYCSLEYLYCDGCTALENLYCRGNKLKNLDVWDCTALKTLYCDDNQLTNLDVSSNTRLVYLDCKDNQLTNLNISGCSALESLYCPNNQLTDLDVSSNTALTALTCQRNQLTSLDVSSHTALRFVYCECNQLTSLNVADCSVFESLVCYGNRIPTLNISSCPKLINIYTNGRCREMTIDGYPCFDYGIDDIHIYMDKTTIVSTGPALVITTQPVKVVAAVGSTAKYTVEAYGPGLKYQWQYRNPNGDNTWKNSGATGNKTNTLSITVAESYNKLQYRCVITDANGHKKNSNYASLIVKTTITKQPVKVTAAVGTTAKYTVAATGADLKYQWQYRNPNGDNIWKNSGAAGSKTNTLSITVAASYNKLQYRCVITDANGTKTNSNYASLLVKTTVTKQPVKVTAAVGATAKYTVTATGADLKYQWQYRNPNGDNTWKNSGATGNKTNTLSVTVAASSNKLQYRCMITDANGEKINSNYASLLVKTTITTQPKNTTATAGKSFSISVKATGTGLKYAWYYKGAGASNFTKSSQTSSTYTYTAKASYNGMQFYCIITDANGNTVKTNTITLTVK